MAGPKSRAFVKKLAKKYNAAQKVEKDSSETPKKSEIKIEEVVEKSLRIQIPQEHSAAKKSTENFAEEIRKVNESYPLVSIEHEGKQVHLAYATIAFDEEAQSLKYTMVEPVLDEYSQEVVTRTIEELHERLDVKLSSVTTKTEMYEYLNGKVDEIWAQLNIVPPADHALKMKYFIFRDTAGYGLIDALMQDPNIEDISCDGIGLPIFIFHRNPLYTEMATSIVFETKELLDSFVMRLAQKANRTVSVAEPLLDGSLEDGSRVQITYGTDISRRGSNFTIRKFFITPLSPIDLIKYGTVDAITLAYLWFCIEKEKSILIAGSTATGKTTFLNVLSVFINPNSKIVSIEDTAELKLSQVNWLPQVTRPGFGPSNYGKIDMEALLKSALRQRPDYLIVGEVRGAEANVLFQGMATGHPGLSTLHADNINAVIDRLTTPPIQLPLSVLQNLDVVVFLEKIKREGKFVRRVGKVVEVESFNPKEKELRVNDAIVWDPATDQLTKNESYILSNIARVHNMDPEVIGHEILIRANILKWLSEQEVSSFDEVTKIINTYYVNPQAIHERMGK
ncbi:MAG: type IV secretion system protein VirB11 [uncultured DHVE6 group euryarchaeote]|nr:MAG: type IV secretion system protein VirB11 [uncultured DHVE6 group euryarchaeote]